MENVSPGAFQYEAYREALLFLVGGKEETSFMEALSKRLGPDRKGVTLLSEQLLDHGIGRIGLQVQIVLLDPSHPPAEGSPFLPVVLAHADIHLSPSPGLSVLRRSPRG